MLIVQILLLQVRANVCAQEMYELSKQRLACCLFMYVFLRCLVKTFNSKSCCTRLCLAVALTGAACIVLPHTGDYAAMEITFSSAVYCSYIIFGLVNYIF